MPLNASIGGGLLRGLLAISEMGQNNRQQKFQNDLLKQRELTERERIKAQSLATMQKMDEMQQGMMNLNPGYWPQGMSEEAWMSNIANTPGVYDPAVAPLDSLVTTDTQAGQKYYGEQKAKDADMVRGKQMKRFEADQAVASDLFKHNLESGKGIPFPNRTALENFAITDSGPAVARRNQNLEIYNRGKEAEIAGQGLKNKMDEMRNEASIASGVVPIGDGIVSINGIPHIKMGQVASTKISEQGGLEKSISEGGFMPLSQAVGNQGGSTTPFDWGKVSASDMAEIKKLGLSEQDAIKWLQNKNNR